MHPLVPEIPPLTDQRLLGRPPEMHLPPPNSPTSVTSACLCHLDSLPKCTLQYLSLYSLTSAYLGGLHNLQSVQCLTPPLTDQRLPGQPPHMHLPLPEPPNH